MHLPKSFTNKIISESGNCVKIRSNIRNMADCNKWVREYGEVSNTQWNTRTSQPNGQKMVCSKRFVCHQSSFNKVSPENNKRALSKNLSCPAVIHITVKLETTRTKQTDPFLKEGLPGIIIFKKNHNHGLNTAETLRFLPTSKYCRGTFFKYFNKGMTVAKAYKYHQSVLQEKGCNAMEMANSRINPSNRSIHYWYDQWRISNLVPGEKFKRVEEKDIDSPITEQSLQTHLFKQELPSDEVLSEEDNQSTENEQLQEETINMFSKECNEKITIKERQLRKEFIKEFEDILEKFNPSGQAMENALAYLKTVASNKQCEIMLHNLGSSIPEQRNVATEITIHHPRSIARSAVNNSFECLASELIVPDIEINMDCVNT